MLIGQRIRELRKKRGLSQGDIAKASGFVRAYISRVEHGHTVPSLETLERFAAALDVPLYRLFYHGADETSAAVSGSDGEAGENEPSATEAKLLLKLKNIVGAEAEDREKRFAYIRRFLAGRDQLSDGANLTFGALAKLFSKI
jgi:transcriptional regulator with XRE-family HTH domain